MHSISLAHPVIGLLLSAVSEGDLLQILTSVQDSCVYRQLAQQLPVDLTVITDNIAVLISVCSQIVRYFCCLMGGRPVPAVAALLLHNDRLNISSCHYMLFRGTQPMPLTISRRRKR